MQDEIDLAAGIPVLHLDKTERSKRLLSMQAYAESKQHDHAEVDWDGYTRGGGTTYLEQAMQRRIGYTRAGRSETPYVQRRPLVTSSIAGMIVETFTDVLVGEGRTPTVMAQGDEDTSAYLGAVLDASGSWATLSSCRDIAGACGEAAYLPLVHEKKPSAESLEPSQLFVSWTEQPGWIPRLVIEQKKVCKQEYESKSAKVESVEYWRTRAWDETHSYVYEDIRVEGGGPDEPHLKAPTDGPLNAPGQGAYAEPDSGEPVKSAGRLAQLKESNKHFAGRCPVVWYQNQHNDDDSRGASDYESCEDKVDALDRLLSMLTRGSTANVDPTLVIKDKWLERGRWPTRAKGFGQKIEVSEVGEASFLQADGASYEQGWKSFTRLKGLVEDRCGVVIVTPETAGSYKSGIALQVLMGRQNSAAGRKRRALNVVLVQIAEIWIAFAQSFGDLVLPLRKVVDRRAEDRAERVTFAPHTIGEGRWIELDWPPYQDPSPADINAGVQAAVNGNGGRPVLSQETAVKHVASMIGEDPIAEMDRIADEQGGREVAFDGEMDLEGAEDLVAGGSDGLGEGDKKVQDEALNGAQVTALLSTLAQVDVEVAPEAAKIALPGAYPVYTPEQIDTMIDEQRDWRAEKTANAPTPPSGPVPPEKSPVGSGAAEVLERQAPEEEDEFALDEG